MRLRKSGITLATLIVAGCSGDVGVPTPVNHDPAQAGGPTATPGGEQAQPGDGAGGAATPEPVEVVDNGDGTVTITNNDGSTQVVNQETGEVVTETPPTQDPAGLGQDPDGPAALPEVTGSSTVCNPGTPESTQLPRLTNVQYDNTIVELLGVNMNLAATTLQADSKGNMDARSWESYQTAASTIATTIISDPTARAAAITCTTQDAACAQEVVTNFGAKVFRRPMATADVDRYMALFNDTTLTDTGSFDEQMGVVLQAMFQSPYFITIAELNETSDTDVNGGTRFALDDFELASRLSYMLWDTMPDQTLLDAAAAGGLTSGTGLADQAARMLQDPRAKGLVERLHMDYMRMGTGTRWVGYERDGAKYPHYSATQIDAVAAETLAVADSVVFSGGSFADLMTTTVGFVNADTAPLYGLDAASYGADLSQVDLGASRPGILTRAGFLAANSYGNRTSPIHRGAFIIKDVLCTPMGNPSPDAASTPLPNDPGLVTNRQKTEAQTTIGADCIGCHTAIVNPPGFALEGFDAVGGVQTEDNGEAVDTTADVLVGSQVVPVTGAEDLMAAIASAPEAKRCYTENWVKVAYNRVISEQDVCTVDDIATRMADPAYSLSQLIVDLATTDNFRFRAHETE